MTFNLIIVQNITANKLSIKGRLPKKWLSFLSEKKADFGAVLN